MANRRRDDFSLIIEGGTLPGEHPTSSDIAFWGNLAIGDGTLHITFVVGAAPDGALPDVIPEKSEAVSIVFRDEPPTLSTVFTDDFLV